MMGWFRRKTRSFPRTEDGHFARRLSDGSIRLVPSAMRPDADYRTYAARDRAHREVFDRAADGGSRLRVSVDLSACSLRALDTRYYTHLSRWVKRDYRDRLQTLTFFCPHKRHLWLVYLMRHVLGSDTRSKVRIVRRAPPPEEQSLVDEHDVDDEVTTAGLSGRLNLRSTALRLVRAACVVWTARRFPRMTWFGLVGFLS